MILHKCTADGSIAAYAIAMPVTAKTSSTDVVEGFTTTAFDAAAGLATGALRATTSMLQTCTRNGMIAETFAPRQHNCWQHKAVPRQRHHRRIGVLGPATRPARDDSDGHTTTLLGRAFREP